jgi:hyperosmotically inducible protein
MKTFIITLAAVTLVTSGCSTQADQVTEQLTDTRLKEKVTAVFQRDASVNRLGLQVVADAAHHAVQLTGVAYTQRQRTKAVDLARSVGDGIAVEDKIEVKPYAIPRDLFDDELMGEAKAEATKMGDQMGNTLDDGWVHMKVAAKLMAEGKMQPGNFHCDIANNVVTLRGTVPTKEGREQAESIAKSVEGVKEVKNRLVVKP